MTTTFLGFPRANNTAGTRNYVLVIPAGRVLSIAATRVTDYVTGTKTAIIGGGEVGQEILWPLRGVRRAFSRWRLLPFSPPAYGPPKPSRCPPSKVFS